MSFSDLLDPADIFGGRAAEEASDVQTRASIAGTEELRRQFDIQQARLDPFFQQAAPAIDLLARFSGAQGQDPQAQAFQEFKDSPGQAFLKSRGSDAVSQALSTFGTGNERVSLALAEEGGDIAAQDFQNQLNRLADVAGIAQTTGSQLNVGSQQFATQIGQQGQNLANIQTQGLLNQQQARQNQLGQLAQLAGAFGTGG